MKIKKFKHKTTALGVIGIVTTILIAFAAMIDDDPATKVDWNLVAVAITNGLAVIFARENTATSEDVGLK